MGQPLEQMTPLQLASDKELRGAPTSVLMFMHEEIPVGESRPLKVRYMNRRLNMGSGSVIKSIRKLRRRGLVRKRRRKGEPIHRYSLPVRVW